MSISSKLKYKFWIHVEKGTDEECWIYKGTKSNAYGVISYERKNVYAHRVSYELHKGTIKEGLYVLHKCNNGLCVNPNHLYEGTQLDNMRDRELSEKHSRGANNCFSSLTEKEVAEIKRLVLLYPRRTRRDIGEQFGVSHATISRIATGKTWTHTKCTSQ